MTHYSDFFDTLEELGKAIDKALGEEKELKKILTNDPVNSPQRMLNDRTIRGLRWQKKTYIKMWKEAKKRPMITP